MLAPRRNMMTSSVASNDLTHCTTGPNLSDICLCILIPDARVLQLAIMIHNRWQKLCNMVVLAFGYWVLDFLYYVLGKGYWGLGFGSRYLLSNRFKIQLVNEQGQDMLYLFALLSKYLGNSKVRHIQEE